MITEYYSQAPEAARALIGALLKEMRQEPDKIFRIALSGGSTPALLFDIWANEFTDLTPWERLHFYWVDERCVSPESPDSNYGMAKHLLFSRVPVNSTQIHRIIGENEPHEEAMQYSALIKSSLRLNEGIPEFDIIFLGIGSDGHTSSIFPGQKSLLFCSEPYSVSVNPYNGQHRIALTGQPLIKALHTWFFVTGQDKADIIRKVLEEGTAGLYPAGYVLENARDARLYTDIVLK